MKRPEQGLQKGLCKLLDAVLPSDCVYFAVPNGGWRKPTEAAILNGMGVKAGVPDLVFVYQGRALFIELKALKGRLTPIQRMMCFKLKAAGASVETARTYDEALAHLRSFGIPLRIKADIRLDRKAA